MTTDVYTHDSEIDIVHKINELELKNWINHVAYVAKELSNIIEFYKVQREKGVLENTQVFKRLEMLFVDNHVIHKSLSEYSNSRDNVRECDSTDCDMVFVKEHETYRRLYRFHIDKYRKQKDLFYQEIKDKMLC